MSQFQDTFISVTELQKNTKKCLGDINSVQKKIILSNNKPQAVILSLSEFEKFSKYTGYFPSVEADDFEKGAIYEYEKRKKEGTLEKVVPTKDYFKGLKGENV